MNIKERVTNLAKKVAEAAIALANAPGQQRDELLARMAELLRAHSSKIMRANAIDMERGEEKGLSSAMLDRLLLNDERIEKMAAALEEIIELPDPLAQTLEGWTRPNGLRIQKVTVPLGVVGIIYESRPNVTVDAAGLCVKAGNGVLLRGGSEAINSNIGLVEVLQDACRDVGLSESCIEIIDFTDREAVSEMARLDEYLNLIVPRGGHGLIRAVTENATVPVLKHDRGMTQIYVDESCDIDMTVGLVHNSKVQRPGVCNAVENLSVHRDHEQGLQ